MKKQCDEYLPFLKHQSKLCLEKNFFQNNFHIHESHPKKKNLFKLKNLKNKKKHIQLASLDILLQC